MLPGRVAETLGRCKEKGKLTISRMLTVVDEKLARRQKADGAAKSAE